MRAAQLLACEVHISQSLRHGASSVLSITQNTEADAEFQSLPFKSKQLFLGSLSQVKMETQNKMSMAVGASSSLVLSDCLDRRTPGLAAQGAAGLTSVQDWFQLAWAVRAMKAASQPSNQRTQVCGFSRSQGSCCVTGVCRCLSQHVWPAAARYNCQAKANITAMSTPAFRGVGKRLDTVCQWWRSSSEQRHLDWQQYYLLRCFLQHATPSPLLLALSLPQASPWSLAALNPCQRKPARLRTGTF